MVQRKNKNIKGSNTKQNETAGGNTKSLNSLIQKNTPEFKRTKKSIPELIRGKQMKTNVSVRHLIFFLFIFSPFFIFLHPDQPPSGEIAKTEELERPKPLSTINYHETKKIVQTIHTIISKEGFSITQIDHKEPFIDAKRLDSKDSSDYDRIILWLERDFNEPDKFLKLYFLYGRYEYIMDEEWGVYRVIINESEKEKKIGKLKQLLITKLNKLGG